MPVKARSLADAVAASSYEVDPKTGCWLWLGALNGSGYGHVHAEGRAFRAHRAFYEVAVGALGEGIDLHHVCEIRRCVNPAHLVPLEHRAHSQIHRPLLEECVNGHPFDETNTRIDSRADGTTFRACRACDRDRKRASYAARAAE